MIIDDEHAMDNIFTLLRSAWVANTDEVAGYVPHLVWPNTREDKAVTTKQNTRAWGRVLTRHKTPSAETLGEPSCKRFERTGLLTVQLLAPVAQRGLTLSQRLGKILTDAIEGEQTADGVWFRNVTFKTIGPDAHWYNSIFTAEFVYDVRK